MVAIRGESAIFAAIREGELRRAVECLLQTYGEEVYSYIARLVGSGEGIAVYQQVLTAALADLISFDLQTSVRAWLFRMARAEVIRHHRAHPEAMTHAADAEYAPTSGPAESSGLQLIEPALQTALARLAPPPLEVLQLTLWHGLSLEEAAHVTGRSVLVARRLAAEALQSVGLHLLHSRNLPS